MLGVSFFISLIIIILIILLINVRLRISFIELEMRLLVNVYLFDSFLLFRFHLPINKDFIASINSKQVDLFANKTEKKEKKILSYVQAITFRECRVELAIGGDNAAISSISSAFIMQILGTMLNRLKHRGNIINYKLLTIPSFENQTININIDTKIMINLIKAIKIFILNIKVKLRRDSNGNR